MRTLITTEPFNLMKDKLWERAKWPAKWISASKHADTQPKVVAFRRQFTIAATQRIRIHVSADERYQLYLDGERIGRGPERGDLENWFYETYDLDLAAGEHLFVALTWWLGPQAPAPFAQISARSAFLLAAEAVEQTLLNTGFAPWEAKLIGGYDWVAPAMTWGAGVKIHLKGADFPWGCERGLGDGWQPAAEVVVAGSGGYLHDGRHCWFLRPALLPPMLENPIAVGTARHVEAIASDDTLQLKIEETNHLVGEAAEWNRLLAGGAALTIPANSKRRAIIDLGDYYCAYPEVAFSGGKGAALRIRWAEALFEKQGGGYGPKGQRDQIEGRVFSGVGDTIEPDGGADRRFEPLWWQAGRYLEVVVVTAGQTLTISMLRLRETHYPFEFQGRFAAADPRLAAVAPLAQRTLEMCSHETYMDCPYYEQLMYIGDTRLEVLTTYAMTGDDRLPRKALLLFDASRQASGLTQSRYPSFHKQIIPPFSLWWVAMVHDFAMWRADPAFVAERLRGVRGVLDFYRSRLTNAGLVEAPVGWNYIDWVPNWVNGMPVDGDRGVSGPITWKLAWVLRQAAELEELHGEPLLAQRHRATAARIAAAADSAFWDEGRGLYADDLGKKAFSEHSQCLALLGGSVPAARRERVVKGLLSDPALERCTIYFIHYLFETYRLLGCGGKLIERMGLWFDLPALGLKTTLEMPEPSRSDCHAWGAHPLFHYAATLLGIRPGAAGFATVSVEPQLGNMAWARGAIPHPAGLITADFAVKDGRVSGTVELPPGITGVFTHAGRTLALKGGKQTV